MIEYTIGVPGSGKTYRAMYALYANFGLIEKLKDKKFIHKEIEFAYTNINEIKIDSFENDKIKKLDWDIFKQHLTQLHTLYRAKVPDTELIKTAKDLDLANCLIILDECHNYLDRNDKILVWWLSYHRHLHQDIYLITQNLALVDSKYKAFSEFFYKAFPSSLKMFSSQMKYAQYTNSRMAANSKSGTTKIPFQKEIYDCYHSGANQQSENLIKKFGIYAILLFGSLIFVIMIIQSYWSPDTKIEEKLIDSKIINAQVSNQNSKKTITSHKQNDNSIQIKMLCSSTFNICLFDNKSIPYKLYSQLKKDNKYKELYFEYLSNTDFKKIYVNVDDIFMTLFKENNGVQNENNTNDNNILFPSIGK